MIKEYFVEVITKGIAFMLILGTATSVFSFITSSILNIIKGDD